MTGYATAAGGSLLPSFAAALVVVVVAVLVAVATRAQQRIRLTHMATPALPCRHCQQLKAARSLTGPAMPTGRKREPRPVPAIPAGAGPAARVATEHIDAPVQNGGQR